MPNEYDQGKYIITKVYSRNNYIPRPPIANIDKLLIVFAPVPQPDLLLIDKLIIYALKNNIEPILVVNKKDIAPIELINDLKEQYKDYKLFVVSAKQGDNIDVIKEYISGCICAVCGQSAVGKSSLLNALIPNFNLQTQELSRKIDRGKHTTRVNELYLCDGLMIADTPGFSSLELDIEYNELEEYYPEFEHYLGTCRYLDCSHIKEGKDCQICRAVEKGEINTQRYNRYIELYNKLKKDWEEKYD